MSTPAPGHVDCVTRQALITPTEKVATMGSCFAQHIAKNIASSGFNYFITEVAPPNLSPQEAFDNNFGVFSARYGNVYTVRQALQLFDRAFGNTVTEDDVWVKEGRFVDAYRPQIVPGGFDSVEELQKSRRTHLENVRQLFEETDWLVFTLGLTECWRHKESGAVFPLAPGVAGGEYSEDVFESTNFTAAEVSSDLSQFMERLLSVNPKIRVILTVSPVPLAATFEDRHVWVSTTYSKAALRVAADEIERKYPNVIYFPSYEIITSPSANGAYYRDDLRQVTELGVSHVMRLFK